MPARRLVRPNALVSDDLRKSDLNFFPRCVFSGEFDDPHAYRSYLKKTHKNWNGEYADWDGDWKPWPGDLAYLQWLEEGNHAPTTPEACRELFERLCKNNRPQISDDSLLDLFEETSNLDVI